MGFQIPRYDKLREAYRERNARISKLRADGMSDAQIAREVGVTRARIGAILGAKKRRARPAS